MSDQLKDGGQAFPLPVAISPMGDEHIAYGGMTLRDYFAAKAMQGGLAGSHTWRDVDYIPKDGYTIMENAAMCAYQMADAMLKARKA